MKSKEIKDLLTGELFIPKRINQHFISSANRIKYHNDKANDLRHSSAYINKPLHINHRILNELLKDDKEGIFHKEFLTGKGYSFNVHTHYDYYNSKKYAAVYQYITILLENDQIKIIKK